VKVETHAELVERKGWSPTDCPGRMVVVDQNDDVWVFVCERCPRFEVGMPTRLAAPELYSARLVEQRRERSGIPPRLRDKPLPNDGSERSRAVRDWATGSAEQPVLMLCGGAGVTKTWLAAAALWERARVGPVRWIYVPELFGRLALGFSDGERHEALRELTRTDTLVLDDIDKSSPKQFAGDDLLCAINMRIEAGAGVLVTTNLMPNELADRYPEAQGYSIVSRLRGHGETFVIDGSDQRLERFAS
jgi:IstB-like ATP binding protein